MKMLLTASITIFYLQTSIPTMGEHVLTHPIKPMVTRLTVTFSPIFAGDTILCMYTPLLANIGPNNSQQLIVDTLRKRVGADGKVRFNFTRTDSSRYGYVFISKDYYQYRQRPNPLFFRCLVRQGDNITATVSAKTYYPARIADMKDLATRHYQVGFTGRGAAKFRLCYRLQQPDSVDYPENPVPVFNPDGTFNKNNSDQTHMLQRLKLADQHRRLMDSLSFQIIKADFVGQMLENTARGIRKTDDSVALYNRIHSKWTSIITSVSAGLSEKAKWMSMWYSYATFCMGYGIYGKVDEPLYRFLKETSQGKLREKVLTCFMLDSRFKSTSATIYEDARRWVANPLYKSLIAANVNRRPGTKAFAFNLASSSGDSVSLQSLSGKFILVDMYFWGCSGCAIYYRDVLKKVEPQFKDAAVVFLSVSIDPTKELWQKAMQSGLYTSTDQSNVLNLSLGEGGQARAILSYYNISAFPTKFLIDPKGNLVNYDGPELQSSQALTTYLTKQLSLQ